MKFSLDSRINKILIEFPAVALGILRKASYIIKRELFSKFLRGQEIFLKSSNMKDKKGRRTVNYAVKIKGEKVTSTISSYPLNLFERTHVNRGRTVPSLRIFSRKLPPVAESILQRVSLSYMKNLARKFERKFNRG